MLIVGDTFGTAWAELLGTLHEIGAVSSPRGREVRELIGVTLRVAGARHNLLVHEDRALSYRFAVAEWLWIWFGRNDVETIAKYNRNISAFSDNGVTFAGAYGPHVQSQWPRVLETLRADRDSRQAVISIYHPPTGMTRDVPCTLTFQLLIRNDVLHGIVSMRSSDIWLGLPYDFFTFSQLCNIAAAQLNAVQGSLTYHLGSSHLYAEQYELAKKVISSPWKLDTVISPALPGPPPPWMEHALCGGVTLGLNSHVWSRYVRALCVAKNVDALAILRKET